MATTHCHSPARRFSGFCSVTVWCRRQVGRKSPRKLRPQSLQLSRLVVVKKTSIPVSIAAQSYERSAPAVVGFDEKSPQKIYNLEPCFVRMQTLLTKGQGDRAPSKEDFALGKTCPGQGVGKLGGPGFAHRSIPALQGSAEFEQRPVKQSPVRTSARVTPG